MDQRKVTIWANCQGNVVKYLLDKYFSNVKVFTNYEFINSSQDVPD